MREGDPYPKTVYDPPLFCWPVPGWPVTIGVTKKELLGNRVRRQNKVLVKMYKAIQERDLVPRRMRK